MGPGPLNGDRIRIQYQEELARLEEQALGGIDMVVMALGISA